MGGGLAPKPLIRAAYGCMYIHMSKWANEQDIKISSIGRRSRVAYVVRNSTFIAASATVCLRMANAHSYNAVCGLSQ